MKRRVPKGGTECNQKSTLSMPSGRKADIMSLSARAVPGLGKASPFRDIDPCHTSRMRGSSVGTPLSRARGGQRKRSHHRIAYGRMLEIVTHQVERESGLELHI